MRAYFNALDKKKYEKIELIDHCVTVFLTYRCAANRVK